MITEQITKWLIDRHNIISFDVFDTLIKRNAAMPADLFQLVEILYNESHSARIREFKANRRLAEKQARFLSPAEEVTIDEIYERLKAVYVDADELKQLELQTERDYCQANPAVKKWFDYCVREKKKIVLISDMYLPKEFVVSLLRQCGYEHYEKIYLSSDYMLTKRTGHLYDAVLKETGAKPHQILHFGDSRRYDMLNAAKKGIHFFPVGRKPVNTNLLKKKDIYNSKSWLLPYINNNIARYRGRSDAFRWGYEALGSLFVGFCLWVSQKAEEEQIEKLYFVARDTYRIFDAYRLLGGWGDPAYLEISRRSLRREFVKSSGNLAAVYHTMPRLQYTAKELLASMGLEAGRIGLRNGFPLDAAAQELSPADWEELNRCVLQSVCEDSGFAFEYLTEQGVTSGKEAALVDIGWHGTIQNMLEVICGKTFFGLYFGSTRRPSFPDMRACGYWFDEPNELAAKERLSIIAILEVMLFPQVGTALEYASKNGFYSPVYDSFCTPKFSFVEEFQQGGMQLIQDLSSQRQLYRPVEAREAARAYERMAFQPSFKLAKAFSVLEHEDGTISTLAKPRSWFRYLFNPMLLIRDYKSARWKEGFIKLLLPWLPDPHFPAVMVKQIRK